MYPLLAPVCLFAAVKASKPFRFTGERGGEGERMEARGDANVNKENSFPTNGPHAPPVSAYAATSRSLPLIRDSTNKREEDYSRCAAVVCPGSVS